MILRRLALLLPLLAMTVPARAAPIDPSLLQNLRWRSIGPFRGGRVLAVQGAPDRRERFYFGAVNGGVWRTDDAGRTWQPIFDAAPVGAIGALAVAPSAPATIYVGTGEADMRSDIAQGQGIFGSRDGGAHWSPLGLADTQQIGRILVDPRDAATVLVAALGHPYGPNAERGIFRSTDGGASWTKTLFHDADTGAIDMAYRPGDPSVVYAALWQTRRPPWNVYPPSSGPGSGLYKSTDGGATWVALTGHGLPAAPGRIGIATTPARPDRVYALIDTRDGAPGAGLYRSENAGADWVRVSDDRRILERAWYFSGITADPAKPDTVWVCDTVMLRSDDGGAHFVPVLGDPTGDDYHSLWIDPADPARRILGVDQGALVSLNGGQSWSSWFNQPTGQFYHVSTDTRFPYRVYGAQQDSGAASVPSRTDSPSDGIGMPDFHESAAGGESDNIAPDPEDPDVVYGGRVDRLDLKSGQMRSVDPTLAFPAKYRSTWTLPLAFGPRDHALYFANQHVFRTADGGQSWAKLSPDLTRPDPGIPATLDAPTRADMPEAGPRRGVVYALAPSPLQAGLIWAGTDDGLIWRTQDDGAHWADVTPPSVGPWSKVGVLEAGHFDAATAYAAIDRHRLDDPAPYLLRTHDGGRSWAAITAGLGDAVRNSVNVVREDPVQRGLLYAGTESGAYVSFDDGAHWQPLQNGLPRTSVRDITVHGDDLVIATHGRGFYVLDDMAQLRTLAASPPAAAAMLFPPAPAIRLHPPAFTGTPMPRDEPMAANPPAGAIIDFVLPPGIAGPVSIAIEDAAGATLRTASSTDAHPAPDPATMTVPAQWLPAPAMPRATPGAQRFVWDLHCTRPAGLHGGDPEPEGVWAPPGTYTVVLTTPAGALRQPLRILPDPRLRLHPGDLAAQYTLARAIETARVQVRSALDDAGHLRETLAHDPARAPLLGQLDDLVAAQPDPFSAARPRPGAPAEGLSTISLRLDRLAQAVDGADAAPTPDAVSGFRQNAAALAAALSRWQGLRASVQATPHRSTQ